MDCSDGNGRAGGASGAGRGGYLRSHAHSERARGTVGLDRLRQHSHHPRRGQPGSHLRQGEVRLGRRLGRATISAEIAANPPIEQTGNIIRIGGHHENLRNISIDYEIQAPENAFLDAGSGSGDITDDGVGENAKISTGSGNIHAIGLHGGFKVDTGSGDIYAEQTGQGDVRAWTGSGNIELRNLRGSLYAHTGSGNIKASGTPAADWKLETGSGNVELWPGSAALTLEASTGSGNVHTDQEMLTHGSSDHHHVSGKINGGGPTVRIETGSGDIRVH